MADTFDAPASLSDLVGSVLGAGGAAALDGATVDRLLDLVADRPAGAGSWAGLFAIGVKPFMDAHTYDQDRVDKCCVHVVARDGTPVSFCEYNAVNRPQGRL